MVAGKAKIVIHDIFNIPGTSKEKSCTLPQITQAFSKSSLMAYRKSEITSREAFSFYNVLGSLLTWVKEQIKQFYCTSTFEF